MTILKHTYQVEVVGEVTGRTKGFVLMRTRRPQNIYSDLNKLYDFKDCYLGKVTKII